MSDTDKNRENDEQKKLLENLKAIQPLTVSLYLKGGEGEEDKLLGTGLFLGENKVVIASIIPEPKEGEIYIVRSILGEKEVSKIIVLNDKMILCMVFVLKNNILLNIIITCSVKIVLQVIVAVLRSEYQS